MGPIVVGIALLFAIADHDGSLLAPREIEFPFEDELRLADGGHHAGKLWRSRGLPTDGGAVPLVVFVHGVVGNGLKHHWLIDDPLGPYDARSFVEELVDDGEVAPLVVAVPSQNNADASDPSRIFERLDFDAFLRAVDDALAPHQRVDRLRVVIVGHSAAACYRNNAAFAALNAKSFVPHAILAIDGCLSPESATLLLETERAQVVVVAYQDQVWSERPFDDFRARWERTIDERWPRGLRIVERIGFESAANAHMELVEVTVRRWLPILLPPPRAPSLPNLVIGTVL